MIRKILDRIAARLGYVRREDIVTIVFPGHHAVEVRPSEWGEPYVDVYLDGVWVHRFPSQFMAEMVANRLRYALNCTPVSEEDT